MPWAPTTRAPCYGRRRTTTHATRWPASTVGRERLFQCQYARVVLFRHQIYLRVANSFFAKSGEVSFPAIRMNRVAGLPQIARNHAVLGAKGVDRFHVACNRGPPRTARREHP